MAEDVTEKYQKEETEKSYQWGSTELEEAVAAVGEENYFKLETGKSTRVKINTNVAPVEKFVTFKEGDSPKRRFDISIYEKVDTDENGKSVYSDDKVWSIAPRYLHQINKYINKTTVFEVTKEEKGWIITPLGLPVE